MVNPLANLAEITYQLENTKARALFVFPMFAQNAYNAKKDVPRIRDIFLYGTLRHALDNDMFYLLNYVISIMIRLIRFLVQ